MSKRLNKNEGTIFMDKSKNRTINSYFYQNKLWFTLLILADVIQALAVVAISYFISRVFAAVGEVSMDSIIRLIPLGVVTLAFFFGTQCLQKYVLRAFLKKMDTQIRADVFSGIMSKDFRDFGEKNTAEYISVMNNELEKAERNYLSMMPYLLETIILTVISAAGLFFYSVDMALVIIVTAFTTIAVPALLGKYTSDATDSYMQGMSAYNVRIKDIFAGYEVIKSFGAEKIIKKVHDDTLSSMEQKKYKYRSVNDMFSCFVILITYLIIIIQYIVAAYLITKGKITLALAMGALDLGHTVNNQAREATSALLSLKGTRKIRGRIEALLSGADEPENSDCHIEALGDISVKNVSFAYSEGKNVLHDINFTFERGRKYAIVGGSGSGKSTFIKLLMQYYDNYCGTIFCQDKEITDIKNKDITDIKNIPREVLYGRMAMIHQKVFMFDDTLKNNITMYKNYSEAEISQAVKDAGLEDVVKNNSSGIEQNVGENGKNLSGGEQQRIAIARALLRKSDVLILDEATSSLDNEVAAKIENTVLNQKDMTAIVITHKLVENILRQYDGIIVMHKGRIAEYGTFDELMERREKFYGLFMLSN